MRNKARILYSKCLAEKLPFIRKTAQNENKELKAFNSFSTYNEIFHTG